IVASVSFASDDKSSPKALYQQRVERDRAVAAAVSPAPKGGVHKPIPSVAPPQRLQGIFAVKQGPVASSEFQVVNAWAGPVPGQGSLSYVVWAGSSGEVSVPPSVPGIIVQSQSPTPDGKDYVETTLGTFLRPGADGPLRITRVDGAIASMATPKGTTVR